MVIPDYLGGVIQRIKAHPATVAKIGTQISTAKGKSWTAFTYAVLIKRAGSTPEDAEAQRMDALVDVMLYGPTEYEAYRLWAELHRWLCPDGYTAANCYRPGPPGLLFDTVTHFGGPLSRTEQETGWPFIYTRYIFKFPTVAM